jgi:hypothetical protein
VPVLVVRIWPSTAEPLTDGSAVLVGAGGGGGGSEAMAAVAAELAGVDPPALLAVTTARSVWPTSPATSVWLKDVAPLTFEHDAPEELQSCHW